MCHDLTKMEKLLETINKDKVEHKTLRDEFAMAYMNAVHTRSSYLVDGFDIIADKSYKMADAMMKARENE